ncbi:hypothetical protein QJQ45_028794, partial [Haematococcus lacustris]
TPELLRKLEPSKCSEVVDALFVFALVYTVAATTSTTTGRATLAAWLQQAALNGLLGCWVSPGGHHYELKATELQRLELCPGALPPPLVAAADAAAAGDVFEFMYDTQALGWRRWIELIEPDALKMPADASFHTLLVPTTDSVTVAFLLRLAIDNRQASPAPAAPACPTSLTYPLLLVGPTGCGKTAYTKALLLALDPERYTPPVVQGFSARTSANVTQALIDAKMDKRRKGVYGPPLGKTAVIFVDDLNMPQPEQYGAQPPIELLRQFMDHGGWYNRDNSFRTMKDIHFIAAMGLPGGGRSFVTSRFTRHFHQLCLTEPSEACLTYIFCTLHRWFLTSCQTFPAPLRALEAPLVAATLDVYRTVCAQLLPTPTKSHYTFNLRDFSRVMQGLQMQDPKALAACASAAGVDQVSQHIKLWCHEVLRVFYDRLVDGAEQSWFLTVLRSAVSRHFDTNLDVLFAHLVHPSAESGATPSATGL